MLATTRFDSALSLEQTITRYVQVYNQHILQKALGHIAPIQVLKEWAQKRPELFNKRVFTISGDLTLRGSIKKLYAHSKALQQMSASPRKRNAS
ncbi:hypothetical protein EDC29_11772 [Marichromatium gracile]|uniref:Integrase catalytic domain-containing protein n=1 Tax=Marichromatium gracile TaxID=1048 RepID=A0A4R4A4X4_MARGR|nr:hypothetical protein EDC29_11772 [Marichromatium gracile]